MVIHQMQPYMEKPANVPVPVMTAAMTRHRRRVLSELTGDARFRPNGPWMMFVPQKKRGTGAENSRAWQPKVYLSSSHRSFLPILLELLEHRSEVACHWKFYWSEENIHRQDKLVFYPKSKQAIVRLIPLLRSIIGRRGMETLPHAASSSEFGLEKEGSRGLYIGADPCFLPFSWRMYRALVVGWSTINLPYLDGLRGGSERWFSRMNISIHHQGPASLSPPPADVGYIQRNLKRMLPAGVLDRR